MPPDSTSLLHHPCSQFVEGADYRVDETGCWVWLRGFDGKGYGRVYSRGHDQKAHRESYLRAHGAIPAGHHVHHRCRNKGCINPAHLEPLEHSAHITLHAQGDWSDLTWDDVREIRRVAGEGGTSIFELGDQYGLGKSEVHNIVTNVKWPDPEYTPGRLISCEECGDEFVATRSHQRFCSKVHRRAWNSRRTARRSRGQAPDGSETRTYSKRVA